MGGEQQIILRSPWQGHQSCWRTYFAVIEHLGWLRNETLGVRIKADFFLHFVFMEVQLTYTIILVSDVQHSDSMFIY